MNTTSSIRHLLATACLSISGLVLCSCQSSFSPNKVADRLETAAYTQVYGFNGAAAPSSRQFQACGAIPDRAHRALVEWMRTGAWKTYNYAMPQYFIETLVPTASSNQGSSSIWALCTDNRGNFLGVLVPNNGDARSTPTVGGHKLIDSTSPRRAELAHSIMKTLEPCDSYRKACRTSLGLTTPEVPSLPIVKAPVKPIAPIVATTTPTAKPTAEEGAETIGDDTTEATTDDPFGTSSDTTTTPEADTTEGETPAADTPATEADPFA